MSKETACNGQTGRKVDPILFVSTRGQGEPVDFRSCLRFGQPKDGGLFVPTRLPNAETNDLLEGSLYGMVYSVARLLCDYFGDTLTLVEATHLVRSVFRTFRHPAVTPLRQLRDTEFLLECHHGPSYSFKDIALSVMGALMQHEVTRSGQGQVLLCATSGDTGGAAVAAMANLRGIELFVLHPHNRISEVQRRFMTCVEADNIHNLAIDGTFDDCQSIVKQLLSNQELNEQTIVGTVNSINWGRIAIQSAYFASSTRIVSGMGGGARFSIPSGNFGNAYSAWVAKKMGVPISTLVTACNDNDTLHQFFLTGKLKAKPVVETVAPAMDIQVPSNLERYIYWLVDNNPERLSAFFKEFRETGEKRLSTAELEKTKSSMSSYHLSEKDILAVISSTYKRMNEILDPHTAVAIGASNAILRPEHEPNISVATAHWAKFPKVIERALGFMPPLPDEIRLLMEKPERMEHLPPDLDTVLGHVKHILKVQHQPK